MPEKNKKKKGNGSDKKEKKKSQKSKKGSKKGRYKSARFAVDIFTEAAMENAYTTCHNVQDLLKNRGFPWPDAQKKKKKGKK